MMTTKFDARIAVAIGAATPDIYEAVIGGRPQEEFVVSRNQDGTIASRYGELTWDISNWDTERRHTLLNFNFWKGEVFTPSRHLLSRDARWLMFALIWLRDGISLRVRTLCGHMTIIRALTRYADKASCGLTELLSDETLLINFVNTSCSGAAAAQLARFLSNLVRIEKSLLGFNVVGDKLLKSIRKRDRDYRASLKQHPPIPTRIYSVILLKLSDELSAWEAVAPECHALLYECGRDRCYGRRKVTQEMTAKLNSKARIPNTTWVNVAPPAVREYLNKHGFHDSVSGLGSAVAHIQLASKLTIQAYSGMRDEEALTLPYDCQDVITSGEKSHLLIRGRTTKLGVKRTRWVTNQEGHRAVAIAQGIADVIYAACGRTVTRKKKQKRKLNSSPLFVSIAYIAVGCGRIRIPPADGHFHPGNLPLEAYPRMRKLLQPAIIDLDLIELERIDPHRAWRSEDKFQIGVSWRLATHQLRRSLALYAQRSGFVTLPSLRRQLDHITEEMTRYYARGSYYAKDIFGLHAPSPDHFCFEWQSTIADSSAISYAVHVLTTNDTLFGGHAAFVKRRLQGECGVISASVREETIRMFRKGQLHYRETLIGGCTRDGECDQAAVDWLNVECISNNCSNMVGSLKKLNTVIAEQERLVQSISPTSLLYRTENAILTKLSGARDKVQEKRK